MVAGQLLLWPWNAIVVAIAARAIRSSVTAIRIMILARSVSDNLFCLWPRLESVEAAWAKMVAKLLNFLYSVSAPPPPPVPKHHEEATDYGL